MEDHCSLDEATTNTESPACDLPILAEVRPDSPSSNPWSPPQFGLGGIFLLMILAAGFFAIVHYLGPQAAFPTLILGGLCWLILGCVRLVRLSRQRSDPKEPEV
jgi:hypothetical protein